MKCNNSVYSQSTTKNSYLNLARGVSTVMTAFARSESIAAFLSKIHGRIFYLFV